MSNAGFDRIVWTYPWDIHELGVNTVVDEIRNVAGANGISVAAAYHAGHFLQPRSPVRRVYFPEDGTVYFRPSRARYGEGRIQPATASIVQEHDVLDSLLRRRDDAGINVNAWLVCLHNTRIGTAYPDVTTVNAFGDRNIYNLCPSNPDVRQYVTTLVSDLTHNYPVDAVELEACHFMGFVHEYHHEKDAVGLTARDDFLFSVCFCGHCRREASQYGVDADKARDTVRRLIDDALQRAVPGEDGSFVRQGVEQFAEFPALSEYIRWRFDPVTSLVGSIRAAARSDVAIRFLSLGGSGAWTVGVDLDAVAGQCDGLVVTGYELSPEQLRSEIAPIAAVTGGRDRYLSVGLRLYYPECTSGEQLGSRVAAALESGANGVHFYNYGLIPYKRLEWIGAANESARR